MKKILSVFLAIMMVFCSCAIAVCAADEETTVAAKSEEATTRNIKNDEGLVVPINFKQLKSSILFKIIEKIVMFIKGLFGSDGEAADQTAADAVSEVFSVIDERLSQVASTVDAASE